MWVDKNRLDNGLFLSFFLRTRHVEFHSARREDVALREIRVRNIRGAHETADYQEPTQLCREENGGEGLIGSLSAKVFEDWCNIHWTICVIANILAIEAKKGVIPKKSSIGDLVQNR